MSHERSLHAWKQKTSRSRENDGPLAAFTANSGTAVRRLAAVGSNGLQIHIRYPPIINASDEEHHRDLLCCLDSGAKQILLVRQSKVESEHNMCSAMVSVQGTVLQSYPRALGTILRRRRQVL
ncbi:hypothetical protein CIB48_g8473 [Xylaria polymorpha]|nr:hypothetical protein CIB48_g8473 [Xylaria polymorpha]